ncbi:MAG: hypothetical protein ACK4FJ_01965 [Ferrovibrio sp.]|uniref:hypothetical protein n=1 Tax=Ferrovibrio sp. TaxID=1917215 RepID=UPI00391B385C
MQTIKTHEVHKLTGLSVHQLREWTVRRKLIQPDVPALKRGQEAEFTWQTILLLRLALVLRDHFHVQLQVHRQLLITARKLLAGTSFPILWGSTLAIYDLHECELLSHRDSTNPNRDAILLRLDPHLEVLSQGLGLASLPQMSLFPAVALHSNDSESRRHSVKGVRR